MSAPSPTTRYLLAHGWTRDDSPADLLDECGADTEESVCSRLGRWQKGGGWRLCAAHAKRAEGDPRA
jgi:hypothetical protein